MKPLIDLCAFCSRIKVNGQYISRNQSLEEYKLLISTSQISHGVCDPCYDRQMEILDELQRLEGRKNEKTN